MPARLLRALALAAGLFAATAAARAVAAGYRVLHALQLTDGAAPAASLTPVGGTLYGTANVGGVHKGGTVFAFNPGSGAFRVLHAFGFAPGASLPNGNVIEKGGVLYGVTANGGPRGFGTIFATDPATGATRIVFRFDFKDGFQPFGGLNDIDGLFYGTTAGGTKLACGGLGCGTIFVVNPRNGAEHVVYAPQSGHHGANPAGNLISLPDQEFVLYGADADGGADVAACQGPPSGCGTVFSLDLRTGKRTVLYYFQGGNDAAYPVGGLVTVGGTLIGASYFGGGGPCHAGGIPGCGAVFAVDPKTRAGKVLYAFKGGSDGAFPAFAPTALGGLLYGTTSWGGTANHGTIFSLDRTTGIEHVLHSFQGGADGGMPMAGLTAVGNTLYGTTSTGGGVSACGQIGCGTVFAITP